MKADTDEVIVPCWIIFLGYWDKVVTSTARPLLCATLLPTTVLPCSNLAPHKGDVASKATDMTKLAATPQIRFPRSSCWTDDDPRGAVVTVTFSALGGALLCATAASSVLVDFFLEAAADLAVGAFFADDFGLEDDVVVLSSSSVVSVVALADALGGAVSFTGLLLLLLSSLSDFLLSAGAKNSATSGVTPPGVEAAPPSSFGVNVDDVVLVVGFSMVDVAATCFVVAVVVVVVSVVDALVVDGAKNSAT